MFTNPGRKMMMLAATAATAIGLSVAAPPKPRKREPAHNPSAERRYRYRGGKQWTPGGNHSWRQLKRAVAHGHEPTQPTDAMKAKHSWYHRPLAAKS